MFAARDWPAVTVAVEDIGRRVFEARRPDFFFSDNWPEEASVQLTLPACLRELGDEGAYARLAAELDLQEELARAFVKKNGWKVMGRLAAKNVSPYRCAKSWRELGKLVPHIAAGRGQKVARLAAIAELRAFRAAHREAKQRWIAGDRDVVFPAGAYWIRVHHAAHVAPFT